MKKLMIKILCLCIMMMPAMAIAHPGHGAKNMDGYSVIHYLTEPVHLISVAMIALSIVGVWFFVIKRKSSAKENDELKS